MGAYEKLAPEQQVKVDDLLRETRANNGLAPVDIEQFWKDQEIAKANPFGENIPQVPLGAICTWECVFDELEEPQDCQPFLLKYEAWTLNLSRRYNDLAEQIVGKRLLHEKPKDTSREWPNVKGLHDIFEAENVWEGGASGSWWLKQSAHDANALSGLLDRVEKRLEHLRDFILPSNWDSEKNRLQSMGEKVPIYRYQRGPCTFACSVFGAENLLFLYYDDPDLMKRFSDLIGEAILQRAVILDTEAGYDADTRPAHWSWADDNCLLFTPQMFEFFAMPIHRKIFGYFVPNKKDFRYQHSDSEMAHLLPLLSELDLKGTNFGPTLSVAEIRRYCPNAVIDGQLAPFTFSRNEEANMVAEFIRDFEQARELRGLHFATAGSINNGSRLTGMRLLMAAIQRYGRFD